MRKLQMVRFRDPRASTAVQTTPYHLKAELQGGGPVTVGFLANGFPDSEQFCTAVNKALGKLLNNLQGAHWNKGNASIPASDDMLSEITARCQAVVAVYGH
jgi:hypothetical protein